MPDVEPRFKGEPVRKNRGRARPDEPLAEWCEAQIIGVCKGRAEVRHHKLRRGRGGSDLETNTMDICDAGGCHDEIHANPEWAYAHGYLIRGVR